MPSNDMVAWWFSTYEVADAADRGEHGRIHRAIEVEVDLAHRFGTQAGDTLDRDQMAMADDADPVGDPLHLGQGVAGEEYGSPLGGNLAHHGLELTLDQGIETRARLIHDEDLRPVHERLDQADLLPIARRQVTDLLGEVGVEAVGQLVDVAPVHPAPQVAEVGDRVAPGQVGVHGEVAGQIPDVVANLDRVLVAVQDRRWWPYPPSGGSRRESS